MITALGTRLIGYMKIKLNNRFKKTKTALINISMAVFSCVKWTILELVAFNNTPYFRFYLPTPMS